MAIFTVCIPSYNAEHVIAATLDSLLKQSFSDWECLVVDDASTDRTESVVRNFGDPRIRFFPSERNLGCPGNFQRARDLAVGEFIYFLANDDVLAPNALERAIETLRKYPSAALIARAYYWFQDDNPSVVIRRTIPLDAEHDRVISIKDNERTLRALLETLGQVTGLVYRNDKLKTPFSPHVWTTHIQPFLETFKTNECVFLHDYLVGVRLEHSQARTISSIYDPSPLWTWATMLNRVFGDRQWERQRRIGIDNIAGRVEGMVQVRCHSTLRNFIREAFLYAYYRPRNLVSPKYWVYVFGCLLLPPRMLRSLVDRIRSAAARHAVLRLVQQ